MWEYSYLFKILTSIPLDFGELLNQIVILFLNFEESPCYFCRLAFPWWLPMWNIFPHTYAPFVCLSLEKILAHFEIKLFVSFATELQEYFLHRPWSIRRRKAAWWFSSHLAAFTNCQVSRIWNGSPLFVYLISDNGHMKMPVWTIETNF